jgi:hypothetical protein
MKSIGLTPRISGSHLAKLEYRVKIIIEVSQVLTGLSITLLEKALERLATETHTAAANWLMQQLQSGFSSLID